MLCIQEIFFTFNIHFIGAYWRKIRWWIGGAWCDEISKWQKTPLKHMQTQTVLEQNGCDVQYSRCYVYTA